MNEEPTTIVAHAEPLIEKLRQIPDADREFNLRADLGAEEFGISSALILGLREAGLPASSRPTGDFVASSDLHYLGIRLGLATGYLMTYTLWGRTLVAHSARATRAHIRLEVAPALVGRVATYLGPDGPCQAVVSDSGVIDEWELNRAVEPPVELSTPARQLMEFLSTLDFYFLPEPLRNDNDFLRTTKFADCVSATRMLAAEAAKMGYQTRTSYGLLLCRPFSTPNCYAELKVENRWVPYDPLLVGIARKFGGLGEDWPSYRSPGSALLRFTASRRYLVSVDDEEVSASYSIT